MIKLVDIKKSYRVGEETIDILHGINLEIKAGELVAIMGPSGSGKSTLMNIIGLLDKPSSGDYYLDEQKVSEMRDSQLAKIRNETMGFVFQSFFLLPNFTSVQNVALPMLYAGVPAAERKERAMASLERINIAHLADRHPSEMSGGQQQRVAFARALVMNPKLILADEPTGALDSKTSQEIVDLMIELNESDKRTIVTVTHDLKVGKQCQKIIAVKDGVLASSLEEEGL